MDYLKKFIDKIAAEAGLGALPEEIQERQKDQMYANLNTRIGLVIMSNLDQKSQEEYVGMIEKKADPKDVDNFLNAKIANFGQLMQNTIDDYSREFLSAFKK